MKICSKCKIEKELSEYHKHTQMKDGLRPDCKQCKSKSSKDSRSRAPKPNRSEYNKKLYNANRESINDRHKRYNEANKEKMLAYSREYYINNKERIKKYQQTTDRKIAKRNISGNRRARIKEGTVTTSQLKELILSTEYCYWCEIQLTSIPIHIDHIIPLSKNGLHTISNLAVTCVPCNLAKGNKLPEDFKKEINERTQKHSIL